MAGNVWSTEEGRGYPKDVGWRTEHREVNREHTAGGRQRAEHREVDREPSAGRWAEIRAQGGSTGRQRTECREVDGEETAGGRQRAEHREVDRERSAGR